MRFWRLVADVGGTNVRFARVFDEDNVVERCSYLVSRFDSFLGALRAYADETGGLAGCSGAAIGAAGPVALGSARLTNISWTIHETEVSAEVGVPCMLINDVEAAAHCLPTLSIGELIVLGDLAPNLETAHRLLVVDIGTGFGAATLVRNTNEWFSSPSEAGHMSLRLPKGYEVRLRSRFKSVEHALSGRGHLLPSTSCDVAALWRELMGFVEGLDNPDLKRLLAALLADPALSEPYREAPAAKQLHHAWLGGLLEHVVSLLNLADRVAPHYSLLDRDLLLTGVLLHDIGKIRELSWEVGFEYTLEGVLLGHIQIGAALAERAMDSLPNFPPKLKTLVLHMILSHHGKLEFGSPKLPMTPEALVLNFLDDLDAKMQAVQGEFDKSIREGKGPDELTGKVWALDNRQMLNTRRWLG